MDRPWLLALIFSALMGVASYPSSLSAKTCKCEQHPADATASGACSLTESGNYCAIAFSGSDSEDMPNFGETARFLEDFEGFNIRQGVLFELSAIRPEGIPDIEAALASAAAAAIPPEHVEEVADDFAEIFGEESMIIDDLVTTFFRFGCIDHRQGELRVLIINTFTRKNGSCADEQ